MDYKKKIKLRICLGIVYLVIGVILCIVSYTGVTDNKFISSFGAALSVVGIARIIQYARLMSDPERMESRAIAEKDERNIMLWEKARSLTFAVYISAAAIAMIVCLMLNFEFTGQIIAYNICGFVFIYWICYAIMKQKY